jgi:hypothetical protein
MYATWARCDGFQRSVITALRLPYAVRVMEAALTAGGIGFSRRRWTIPTSSRWWRRCCPAFPQNEEQMQVTLAQ